MFINKIGMEHLESGVNCQDYGIDLGECKVVCDGCSEGKHSEVGAKLFCHLFSMSDTINEVFKILQFTIGNNPSDLKNFLCFTILRMRECVSTFHIYHCGDGFVILQDHNGNITFEELSDGEYPKYYIYNYIDKEHLKHYKEGVDFTQKVYPKDKYTKVGIASDGLRFILKADEELKQEFVECLKSGKELKTKLFINRNHKIFRDDITIVF